MASASRCAPPKGSLIISSIIPSSNKSFAVNFIASAACKDLLGSLHRIEAHPSGDITEYIEFSSIITLLDDAKAMAPPDPPSPIMMEIFGTFSDMLHSIEFAIAEA